MLRVGRGQLWQGGRLRWNSARRNSSIPSPVTQESGEDPSYPFVVQLKAGRRTEKIDLVEHDDLRTIGESRAVGLQLTVHRSEALDRIVGMGVDDVDEEPCSLEMGEELVPEPDAVARPFEQARNVGDDELAPIARLDRPEHRCDRRKRVGGNLRCRPRDPAKERRLARIWKPEQRGVRQQLEPKVDRRLLPRQARLGKPRRRPLRSGEALVAGATTAAAGDDYLRIRTSQVGGQRAELRRRPGFRPERARPRPRRRRRGGSTPDRGASRGARKWVLPTQ